MAVLFSCSLYQPAFTRRTLLIFSNPRLGANCGEQLSEPIFTPGKVTLLFLGLSRLFLSFFSLCRQPVAAGPAVYSGSGVRNQRTDLSKRCLLYIFQLPFWRILYTFYRQLLLRCSLPEYLFSFQPYRSSGEEDIFHPAEGQAHLSLVGFLLSLKAWDYRLKMFELLFPGDLGLGYKDLHANLPALWILLFLSLVIVGLLLQYVPPAIRLIYISIGRLSGLPFWWAASITPWSSSCDLIPMNMFLNVLI